MKPIIVFLGIVWSASPAFGQSVSESSTPQMLCAPFVSYAKTILRILDDAAEKGSTGPKDDMLRHAANTTVGCAESQTRLWSHPKADAELVAIQKRYETGTAKSTEVGTARVDVVKATYCEAAFSNAVRMAELHDKRRQLGSENDRDIEPVLNIVADLVPVCGWTG